MKKGIKIIVLTTWCLIFLVAGAFCENGRSGWPVHLRILSGPKGGQWFSFAGPLSHILSQDVLPSTYHEGGGISNIKKINAQMGDLGFSLNYFLGRTASGILEDEDIQTNSVSVICNIYPQVLYFLIRRDLATRYNLVCVEDLLKLQTPIRFSVLKRGTASEFFVRGVLKYGYKMDYALLRGKGWRIFFNNYAEAVDAFVSGELDCFAYTSGSHVPLLVDMENYIQFTALPVKDNILNRLKNSLKMGEYTIRPDIYKSITKPIKTLGDFTCIIVRKDLPDSLVYSILASLWNHKKDLLEKFADFKNYSPDTAIPRGVPLHPGAEKFWEDFPKYKDARL